MKSRDELRSLQLEKLNVGLARLSKSNRFYVEKFARAGLSLGPIACLEKLFDFPYTEKHELLEDQAAHPPFGTNLTDPLGSYHRLHLTSGTSGVALRWVDTAESWGWILDCWDEIYRAAEIGADDRLFFPFSFGPFLGFWAAFEAAIRGRRFALPGGGLTSAARLRMIREHGVAIVLCTPSYALRLAEAAEQERLDLRSAGVRGLILAGEPGGNVPATRTAIESAWNARVFDHSGMTEIGSLGVEYASHPARLYLMEDQCIAEFRDWNTGSPAREGELAELVLTNLGRWSRPLIRYRTGDIVRWRWGEHPAGRPFVWLEGGILGRIDDMFFVRGNNVFPSAVENVMRGFEEVRDFQILLDGPTHSSEMTIRAETRRRLNPAETNDLARAIVAVVQRDLCFRPGIELTPPGTLPVVEMKSRRVVRTNGAGH